MTRSTDVRGFTIFDEVPCTYGSTVTVKESSAIVPRLWLFTKGGTSTGEGASHFNPAQARRVRDAIDAWLAEVPQRHPDYNEADDPGVSEGLTVVMIEAEPGG
jgi:hypothetical protein